MPEKRKKPSPPEHKEKSRNGLPEFRAWLKDEERMARLETIVFNDPGEGYIVTDDHCTHPLEHVEIMIGSGLADVEGKTIFDLDIVEFDDSYKIVHAIVKYFARDGCWILVHPDFCRTVTFYKHLTRKVIEAGQVKVVGNFHQNPELREAAIGLFQNLPK